MKKLSYLFSVVVIIITFIIPAESFSQRTEGAIVFYTFEEVVDGNTIKDVSEKEPIIDLIMTAGVTKIDDRNGVVITNEGTSYTHGLFSTAAAEDLAKAIQASNALTVEFWGLPVDTLHDDARLVSNSADGGNRNFSLMYEYGRIETRLRTTTSGNNGYTPNWIAGSPQDKEFPEEPFHVIWTYEAGTEYVYFNGEELGGPFTDRGSDITNWDLTYKLIIGTEDNNTDPKRQFEGKVFMVAIYDKALTADEIVNNFDAGSEPFIPEILESNILGNQISVFPNPVSDELLLKLNGNFAGITYLSLHNCLGEIISKGSFSGSEYRLDMNSFHSGVYFITLTSKQGKVVKKIVKN